MYQHKHIGRNALAAILIPITIAAAAEWRIDWHTIDGGGSTIMQGNGFKLGGTIGQADAGTAMSTPDLTLTGGFWSAPAEVENTVQGDCNGDGLIGLLDHVCFDDCVSGPSVTADSGCLDFDFDDDSDVDFADWQALQLAFTR
jgi:hypothetical protein